MRIARLTSMIVALALGASPTHADDAIRIIDTAEPEPARTYADDLLVLLRPLPAFGGWIYWRAVSPLALERIEARSAVTAARPITGPRAEALAASGSYDTRHYALRASDRLGPVGVELAGDILDTAGYTPIAPGARGVIDGPAAGIHHVASARLEHTSGGSTERAFGRWFEESAESGTQHQKADIQSATYGGSWNLVRDVGRIDAQAYGGEQRLTSQTARVAADRDAAAVANNQSAPSQTQGATLTITSRSLGAREHVLVIGGEVERVSGIASDSLVPPVATASSIIARTAGGEQRYFAAFAQDTAHATSTLDITAALRIDGWQSLDGVREVTLGTGDHVLMALPSRSQVQLDPRLSVLEHVTGGLAVRASGYRAFRAPTLGELYRSFQIGDMLTDPNDNLRPETMWGTELGPELTAGPIVARASAFWNELDSPIDNVTLTMPMPDGAMRQRRNLGHARVAGVTVDASWRPAPAWFASLSYTFADTTVTSAPEEPMLVGKRLAQAPRQRAIAQLTYDEPSVATITAQVRYVGGQYDDDRNTLAIDPYALVDLAVGRPIAKGFSGFVAVENLFDRRYVAGRSGVDMIGPPRLVQVGVRFDSARL